jgi:hypothetical protein
VLGAEYVFRVGHIQGKMAPQDQNRRRASSLNQVVARDLSTLTLP